MKRLIFVALAVTLALAIVWVPSVAAVGPYPIPITKTIPPGGPIEDFTFEAWRDMNNNGIIDFVDPWPDILVGTVVITGAGSGVILSPYMGNTIVHEVLIPGSAYEQQPDQIVHPPCGAIIFNNDVQVQEVGQIVILKKDEAGNALAGATFEISPNPKTGELPALTIVDEGLNDEAIGIPGVLSVSECMVCVTCDVTETVPPPGYTAAPPQTAHVTTAGETVELTFVNTEEKCELIIRKLDESRNLLAGACFTITPDPRTGEDFLELCDNDLNDECPLDGILCLSELICGLEVTVEETTVPDGYEGADPRTVTIGTTAELNFVNTEEKCELVIYKVDGTGNALAGACFTITPDPRTGTGSLELCDNGINDECPEDGVLCLSGLICGLECTVEETKVPDGYIGADPQTVTIGETVELTFVNTQRTPSCGTVCAAQTAPGEYLFGGGQNNWFTWIYYNKGWGTEASPKTYPIYTGQTHLCGTLYVYDKVVSPGVTHVFVNYVLADMDGCTVAGLSEYHLQVDSSLANLKNAIVNKGGNPVPGKCEYKGSLDPMQPATGWIEATNDNISGWSNPIYIFAHGVGCYYCP
jgi:hypothetical protein